MNVPTGMFNRLFFIGCVQRSWTTLCIWDNFVQNVILYLFKSRDKLNTLTEVLSVETANRRERHPGDSPQATDFKNKRIVQKNRVDSAGEDLNGTENFRILKKSLEKI